MNILQMSISGGILIVLIVLLRALAINKLPKNTFLILWGIALIRLAVPFSIPLLPTPTYLSAGFAQILSPGTGASSMNDGQYVSDTFVSADTKIGPPVNLSGIASSEMLMIIWLAGAVVLAVFFTAVLYRSCKELRTALPIRNHALIDRWLREQQIFRPIQVLIFDKITTPIAFGFIKPKIILPKTLDTYNEPLMKYILTHELMHIKRFDVVWKFLSLLVLCIHWFNPLVWILYVLMNRDLELACDEKVIKHLGESRKSDYALSLITMAEQKTKFAPLYNGFSKNATQERIVSIMKFKKASALTVTVSIILTLGAVSVFAAGSSHEGKGSQGNTSNHHAFEGDMQAANHSPMAAIERGDGANPKDESLKNYADYGISYDQKTDHYLFGKKIIRLFIDENVLAKGETNTLYFDAAGDVDIKAVRSTDNKIEKLIEVNEKELENLSEKYGFRISDGNMTFN